MRAATQTAHPRPRYTLPRLLLACAVLIGLLAMHGASADHMLAPWLAADGHMIATAGMAPHPTQQVADVGGPASASRPLPSHAVLSSPMSAADPSMTDCVAVLVEALSIALLAWLLNRRRGIGRETLTPPDDPPMAAPRQRWRASLTLPQLGISRT